GGFPMGGIMGAGTKMMAGGLSIGQGQGITRETIAYAREKIGDEAVGEIVGAIPGVSQFVLTVWRGEQTQEKAEEARCPIPSPILTGLMAKLPLFSSRRELGRPTDC